MKKSLIPFLTAILALACGNSGIEPVSPSQGGGGTTPVTPVVSKDNWAALADSCTNVLVSNFLDKSTGTFWSTPNDIERSSQYIYWQQAHALDVLLYHVERTRSADPNGAAIYLDYAAKWVVNYANNYNRTHRGEGTYGGFFNQWTDDMAWICLTLFHISEVAGNASYADTAREVFDRYIWPRRVVSSKGTGLYGLPWTDRDEDRNNLNACTNAPSCLVAALLYERYKVSGYLDAAKMLYQYCIANMPDTERVEEPPLSYTQGTFGEACRRLYHLTGDKAYMDKAGVVLQYAFTSNRCTTDGIPRSEGQDMDQSIFKAVLIPYAVNYVLDANADAHTAQTIKEKLVLSAKTLSRHLDRGRYPRMYCDYYWGTTFNGTTASMGAQASGASLMEGVARLPE
ncbi:MAG: alpha-1,6-mannanase [Bacteroidales bacterium]|nr:alpha-1,6-mannanase [Bacteroidales bacterium]